MKHSKVCANDVPGVLKALPQGEFYIGIYITKLRKYSFHDPLAGMHCKLTWSFLGTLRLKFGQMKYLGS